MLGSNKGIKLISTDGKFLGNILEDDNRITLGQKINRELGSLDGYFDSSIGGKLEGLFLGGS